MKFSVIIPAHNEEKFIGRTVELLSKQTISRQDYEIIVVDAGSLDATSRVAKAAGADKVISGTSAGTNFARQKGVLTSKGEIVAFLDADCEPRIDWLERISRDLAIPGVAAVSGPYDYGFRGLARFFDRFYSRVILAKSDKILPFLFGRRSGVILGGNFGARRSIIEKIGGLPPLRFWGDDAATAMMISRKAGRVLFDPDLIVGSSPRRFEREGMLKSVLRYMRAYLKVYFIKEEKDYVLLNRL